MTISTIARLGAPPPALRTVVRAVMIQEAPLIYLRGIPRLIVLFFPRAAHAQAPSRYLRPTNDATVKVPDAASNN
jgi:hypothetical protein